MISNLIFFYSGWFFVLPVLAFAVCNLGGVAGALTCEDSGEKVIEYLNFLHIPGNQVSHFLPERACIFHSLAFIADIPIEGFLVVLGVPGQI